MESNKPLPGYAQPESCMAKLLYLVALELEADAKHTAADRIGGPYSYDFYPDIFHWGEKAVIFNDGGVRKGGIVFTMSHNIASEMEILPPEIRSHYADKWKSDVMALVDAVMDYCSELSADELMAVQMGDTAEAVAEIKSIISSDPRSERALRDLYSFLSRSSCKIHILGEIEPDYTMRILLEMRDWANPELLSENNHKLHESTFGIEDLATRFQENHPRPHGEALATMASEFVRDSKEKVCEDEGFSPSL